jgi:hypothetical protein
VLWHSVPVGVSLSSEAVAIMSRAGNPDSEARVRRNERGVGQCSARSVGVRADYEVLAEGRVHGPVRLAFVRSKGQKYECSRFKDRQRHTVASAIHTVRGGMRINSDAKSTTITWYVTYFPMVSQQ